MLKNYVKVAFRSLLKQPAYTALNIIGLTVGIASSLIILLYIFHETSFDKQHSKADRVYRLSTQIREPDNSFKWASMTWRAAMTIKNENPEVVQATRLSEVSGQGGMRFTLNQVDYFQNNVYAADSTIFEIFDYDFISGNPETALEAPNSIVINESMAKKIFKNENPVGQTLQSGGNREMSLQVTGVYKDVPKSSHLIAEALVSWKTIFPGDDPGWGSWGVYSYVLVNEGVGKEELQVKLDSTVTKYIAPIFEPINIQVQMIPVLLQDIHLNSEFEGEPVPAGDIKYVRIFTAIAIFLIIIASINYMNLATARSAKRAMEVGLRKVMGAQRGGLIGQFLTESILITLISLALSILIIISVVPSINNLVGTSLDVQALLNTNVILSIIGVVIITGFIGGSYPAFFLSSFQPAAVLKGGAGKSGSKILRKGLVTLQFAISMFMLIGTFVIYAQMQFVRNKDLGFDKDQVIQIDFRSRADVEKWNVLKNELLQNPNITGVGSSSSTPGNGHGKNVYSIETEEGPMDQRGLDNYRVDYDFFKTLGVEVVAGRSFSLEYPSDSSQAVMVNEAMVRRMDWSDPIGKKVNLTGNDSLPSARVVGVVKDFHQKSLYEPISALMFLPSRLNPSAVVKISGDVNSTIDFIEEAWDRTYATTAFEYTFLDQQFMENYEEDQIRGQLFLGFSGMTILIACLGLLGLASYTAEQRSKEISIRKVLGANTGGLVGLLIRDFIILILIAAIPACILGYYSMMDWLETFQFHITPGVLIFSIVLLGTVLVTVLTTGYHARKAATANPAQKLRSE
ncbi:MAG: ABC transporter permease [Roseivirga sp.]|jgi:putative ABC transport system permease protein|uniref:ABC transporter permease n=1 Tax=Roseivirga sp. TaxID=1964215 RepID=UPI001B093C20|nr:ABC transporter permease [Roseivirga sp.]MBO6496232.1 ABC transporter permease [Roseivirga sp.]